MRILAFKTIAGEEVLTEVSQWHLVDMGEFDIHGSKFREYKSEFGNNEVIDMFCRYRIYVGEGIQNYLRGYCYCLDKDEYNRLRGMFMDPLLN